jgi:hypothetical protein
LIESRPNPWRAGTAVVPGARAISAAVLARLLERFHIDFRDTNRGIDMQSTQNASVVARSAREQAIAIVDDARKRLVLLRDALDDLDSQGGIATRSPPVVYRGGGGAIAAVLGR